MSSTKNDRFCVWRGRGGHGAVMVPAVWLASIVMAGTQHGQGITESLLELDAQGGKFRGRARGPPADATGVQLIRSPPRSNPRWTILNNENLHARAQAVTRAVLGCGALAPIRVEVRTIVDRGVNVELRYVDALSHKDVERAVSGDRPAGQRAPFNPFLPYDERLFVADAGPEHVIILNKFPAIPNHVLLITRAFVDQEAILSVADFTAIAQLMAGMRGIVFFNGGRTGGGSQPHRHFQLIPVDALPVEAALRGQGSMHAQQLDSLPWRHAFAQHAFDPHADVQDNGARLFDIFRQCCASAGVVEQGERLSPFNLLLTRRWMMVIPRTRECWDHAGQSISINALGFGGMLLLRSPELAATVERFGALSILTSVTQ